MHIDVRQLQEEQLTQAFIGFHPGGYPKASGENYHCCANDAVNCLSGYF
jgi:hypothetical protein